MDIYRHIDQHNRTYTARGNQFDVQEAQELLRNPKRKVKQIMIVYEDTSEEATTTIEMWSAHAPQQSLPQADFDHITLASVEAEILYDAVRGTVYQRGSFLRTLPVSTRMGAILTYLARAKHHPVTSEAIAKDLRIHTNDPAQTVRQAVGRIRTQIHPDLILRIPNQGYVLNTEVSWQIYLPAAYEWSD